MIITSISGRSHNWPPTDCSAHHNDDDDDDDADDDYTDSNSSAMAVWPCIFAI